MHSNIHYTGEEAEKRAKALEDLKNWFGLEKFNSFSADVKACKPPLSREQFRFACMIGGVEGYPVEVWADELGVPQDNEEN